MNASADQCRERYRLATEWSNAVSMYADAVRRYVRVPQSSDVEAVRGAAERAKLAVEAHGQEDGWSAAAGTLFGRFR
jgi:hypothetical protein